MRDFLYQVLNFIELKGLTLLTTLSIAIFGFLIIRNLLKIIKIGILHTPIDTTLVNLILTVIKLLLYLTLILYCLNLLDIPLTGFVAAFSALALAIGLAVQNIISSVANSIMLVAVRPFRVGDFVEINGTSGTIQEINLIHTVMNTPDNRRVLIPNSSVFNSSMINYSANEIRRLDVKISIDYDADTELARQVLLEVCQNHSLVLSEPAPQVRWNAHADSYIECVMRVWCRTQDYWPVTWDLDEAACTVLQKNNINIPFPQLTLSYREPAESAKPSDMSTEKHTKVAKKDGKQVDNKKLSQKEIEAIKTEAQSEKKIKSTSKRGIEKDIKEISDKIKEDAATSANMGNSEAEGDR